MSQLFGHTLREVPSDAEIASHQLLLRAGYMVQLGAGIFNTLHLGKRVQTKIEKILRDEMDAIGGQEISMPVVQPADVWKQTGRYYQIGAEMSRFKDRKDSDMVLAMTHEEATAYLTRALVQSYKHLPRLVYHIQTKWRDDPRPRAGLIRVREFTMKDSYSLDADYEGLERQYRAHYQSYFNIFHRCGLPVVAVKSDTGMMGGKLAHEFMYLAPIGEDTLIHCEGCGYIANRQIASFRKAAAAPEEPRPLEKIATPGTKTIRDLAALLNIPEAKTAKAVFMVATISEADQDRDVLVFAVVRGDMDVNETKLTNAVKAKDLRPARDEEIRAIGAEPGYASPIGLKGALIVVDDSVASSPNLVAGANEEGFHLGNVNYGRDFSADIVTDIAVAEEGYACPDCGAPLRASRGVEVGNIFKLGTRYSDALGCVYTDAEGKERPVIMGSYGIGVGRLMACAAEEHHDEYGLIWPISIAPYQVHLVSIFGNDADADAVYQRLTAAGIEVLYDDRNERPGVKFNDADLIGIPLRVTVSQRSLEAGGVEFKRRADKDKTILPLEGLEERLRAEIAALQAEIDRGVVEVTYRD
ncbi:proline--tRNA ligase [Ornatilinea apprima]|uniref:Proline--tRNA ligase n=1 Tax=Ornatilinea apprima TaxID=1134406 RepID=A0A0N8GMJ9_9CHLR|nr:proline--tRNA ligase [Ornatilinea apprima]